MAGKQILARYLKAMYARNVSGLVAAVRELGELLGREPSTGHPTFSITEMMNDVANHSDSPTIQFGSRDDTVYISHPRHKGKIRLVPHGDLIRIFNEKRITTDWLTWDEAKEMVPDAEPPADIPLPRPVARFVAPVLEAVAPEPAPAPAPTRPSRPAARRPAAGRTRPRRRQFPVTTFVGTIASIAGGLIAFSLGWWYLVAAAALGVFVALRPRTVERAPVLALLLIGGAALTAAFHDVTGGIAIMMVASLGMYLAKGRRMQKLATVPIWVLATWLVPDASIDAAGIMIGIALLVSLRVRR